MKYTMQNGKTLLIVSGGSIDINFSKEYIHIINREKPIIDYSLLDKQINSRDSVIYLRIDNWLKFFLE